MRPLILPANVERVVPPWFAAQMRDLDPNLICYFNPMRERWVIDRCTRGGVHNASLHEHTNECPRTNVKVVNDAGAYMPLCQAVLDELRSQDRWSQHGSFEQYALVTQNAADADVALRKKKIDDLHSETTRDDRRQLLRAFDLIQTHDTARVNR